MINNKLLEDTKFLSESLFNKHYPEQYQYILDNTQFLPEDTSFSERKYCILNKIKERPKCKICDNGARFISIKAGYMNTCCRECDKKLKSQSHKKFWDNLTEEQRKEKVKHQADILEKETGYRTTFENPKIKNKCKATCLEKYGVENPFQSEFIKQKIKQTVKNNPSIKEIKILKLKYAWTDELKESAKNKRIKTNLNKFGKDNIFKTVDFKEYMNSINSEIQEKRYLTMKENNTFNTSIPEEKVFYSLLKLYKEVKRQYKSDVYPFNCDFYIPEEDLYIECNFSWTHQPALSKYNIREYDKNNHEHKKIYDEIRKISGGYTLDSWTERDPLKIKTANENNLNYLIFWNYEEFLDWILNKYKQSDKFRIVPYIPNFKNYLNKYKDKILFWDFEWENKKDICESILNDNKQVIYARKCEVKEIENETCKEFIDKNHIQSYSPSSIKLGLFYNDELVEVMTFGKPRFNKNYEYELIRLCSILNTTIIGGASKLFKYFINKYNPNSVISYCDKRIFKGEIYKKLNFKYISSSGSNYNYVGKYNGNRMKFQKHKLKDLLENFNNNQTELWNMEHNESYPVYDLGNDSWIWNK